MAVSWWREHQRKDAARKEMDAACKEAARKRAILDSGDYRVLAAMIDKPQDIASICRPLFRLAVRHSPHESNGIRGTDYVLR